MYQSIIVKKLPRTYSHYLHNVNKQIIYDKNAIFMTMFLISCFI